MPDTGYLTPDSIPFDSHCRTFRIPNDVQWLSVFMGALYPLVHSGAWQQFGTLTPDEASEEFLNIIWDAYEQDEGICPVVGTPFWDTATDVDDNADPTDQPWYGVLTVTG